MLSFYDSRTAAKKLNIPLARFKRWARDFLPPDNLGGYQSGYARQYNLNEAFIVYFGGFLVHDAKLSIPQAKTVVSCLEEYLPNLYTDLKATNMRELKLYLVLDANGLALCKLQNGVHIIFEDEAFEVNIKDFIRVVLAGRLLHKFMESLNF